MIDHKQFFGDGEKTFRLDTPQIHELERLTGYGIGSLCQRLFTGQFSLTDVRETIRLSLIGGGIDPQDADSLLKAYVDQQPLEQGLALAVTILDSRFSGVETEAGEADDA